MQQRIAVRAVIVKDHKVLMIREASSYEGGTNHGKYDFVGGKVEVGETVQEALNRESLEEIGIEVTIGDPFFVSEWRPEIRGEKIQIICVFFLCSTESTDINLGQDFDDYKWISIENPTEIPVTEGSAHVFEALRK